MVFGVLDRFGPLALFGAVLFMETYHNYAFTLDPARTHFFGLGLAAIAGLTIVAGLAATIACGRLGLQRTA